MLGWLTRRIYRTNVVMRLEAMGFEHGAAVAMVRECEREHIDPERVVDLVARGMCGSSAMATASCPWANDDD